ncbi:MAG TPA: tyrosine--tRNA ligase [Ktedonobacterales bacterium]|jgi:tyrosyl-tRNA synthetase
MTIGANSTSDSPVLAAGGAPAPGTTSGSRGDVVDVLRERGLINQITETGLAEAAAARQLFVYCGFDPTAPSLHLGNLVPVMALAHFQRHGHRPIVLIGGGTGMIGDPSGKSAERVLLSTEAVQANAAVLRRQLAPLLAFEGPNAAIMLDNATWLEPMSLIAFLRDIGKHFTVNAMLAKESVKLRLESRDQGISFTEFSYMVLQATDFLRLFEDQACTVQVGGSDQWGNITAGVDLIRRTHDAAAHGLTTPLLTTASGAKFGKSEKGAIFLDPTLTTPYEMYQYWINVDDRDVATLLRIFTFLPVDEIAELERRQTADPAARPAQRALALAVTGLIHGETTAHAVETASRVIFGGSVEDLTPDVLPHLAAAVPTTQLPRAHLKAGLPILETLVTSGLARSKGAARTLVTQGGLYVNDQRWSDPDGTLTTENTLFDQAILLRSGKRTYHLLLAEG